MCFVSTEFDIANFLAASHWQMADGHSNDAHSPNTLQIAHYINCDNMIFEFE